LSERRRNVAEGERVSDRLAGETEIGQGYPEEQPGEEGAGRSEDQPPREGAKAPRKHDDQADEHGKATGNPHDHD
jgi:hypothetical protein